MKVFWLVGSLWPDQFFEQKKIPFRYLRWFWTGIKGCFRTFRQGYQLILNKRFIKKLFLVRLRSTYRVHFCPHDDAVNPIGMYESSKRTK